MIPRSRSAIALLPQINPDVVITDIVMPDGEGMELILHLARSERAQGVRKPFGQQALEAALTEALAVAVAENA